MTRTGYHYKEWDAESGVANLIEYLMISAVIMALLMVMLLLVNTNIMENPANQIVYVEFTDIGNGISTRMVDVYAIAPKNGTMSTKFDIPNEIVGKDYAVNILGSQSGPECNRLQRINELYNFTCRHRCQYERDCKWQHNGSRFECNKL